MTRHLIAGGGVAGTTAAEFIRKTDPSAHITLVGSEPETLYSRILLPEYLAGSIPEERLLIRKPDWYAGLGISYRPGTRVTDVRMDERVALLDCGAAVPFDRLLLATGGQSFIPPLPGTDKAGVFALRTLADAKAILAHVRNRSRVVVIGGGVLGLEAGFGLLRLGKQLTVVEVAPRLLPRQMDPEGSLLLKARMEAMGFRFVLDARCHAILGGSSVEGLELEDGTRIDADLVLVSAGVRPDRTLPDRLGLALDRGLPVNDRMETVLPDVFAAGDLVQHRGIVYGIWPAAMKQGEVAGINMAGGDAVYTGTTVSNQLKVAGIDLLAAGDIDPENRADRIVLRSDDGSVYRKLVLREGRIAGVILYGDIRGGTTIIRAMERGTPVDALRPALEKWDLTGLQG